MPAQQRSRKKITDHRLACRHMVFCFLDTAQSPICSGGLVEALWLSSRIGTLTNFPSFTPLFCFLGPSLRAVLSVWLQKKKKSPNKTCQMLNKQLKCQIFIIMGRKKTIAQSMKAMTDVWSFDPSISGEDIFIPK
jgi:hypothetical protein